MSLATKAMVINLQIGIWSGHRLDKEASAKVTAQAGADTDAARVNKHLVPKTALADVVTAQGAIRTHFYAKTLPWKDNGDRLLTRAMAIPFMEEHERLKGEFNRAVEEFLTKAYPAAYDQAQFRMGALFKPDDYPSAASLRQRFYVNTDYDPITDTSDFRVSLDEEHAIEVRGQMERAMNERIGRAMKDIWVRLAEVVGHFATTMAKEKQTFRDTTVSNITELVELLPGLNVLDDPELTQIGEDIKAMLDGVDPKDLRKKPEIRSQAAKDAEAIMAKMSGFMAATAPQQLAA